MYQELPREGLRKCIKVVLRASEWCIMEKLFVSPSLQRQLLCVPWPK